MPVSLTISGQYLLYSHSVPDNTMFALVIEACNEANKPKQALEVFSSFEKYGLVPDRRIYSSLIKSFGIYGDVASALGVFEEMRGKFVPDVNTFQSVLDVCKMTSESDQLPYNLRLMCSTIGGMEEDGLDLDVYCKDIVMQGFPDAITLGDSLLTHSCLLTHSLTNTYSLSNSLLLTHTYSLTLTHSRACLLRISIR